MALTRIRAAVAATTTIALVGLIVCPAADAQLRHSQASPTVETLPASPILIESSADLITPVDARQPEERSTWRIFANAAHLVFCTQVFWFVTFPIMILGAALSLGVFIIVNRHLRTRAIMYCHVARTDLTVEIGLCGALWVLAHAVIVSMAATLLITVRSDEPFNTETFLWILLIMFVSNLLLNITNGSSSFRLAVSPGAGRVTLFDRKERTGALLQGVAKGSKNPAADPALAHSLLTDLLDIVVMHVRDYRGTHREDGPEVAANFIMEAENEVIVVARDALSRKHQHVRPVPKSETKRDDLLCWAAIREGKNQVTGELREHDPEGPPKNYRSVLALPLFPTDSEQAFAALSIDCTRPHFFKSLVPGADEKLAKGLQPYMELFTLIIESHIRVSAEKTLNPLLESLKLGSSSHTGSN